MCILSPDSNDTDREQIVQERPEVNLLLQINKRFCVNKRLQNFKIPVDYQFSTHCCPRK